MVFSRCLSLAGHTGVCENYTIDNKTGQEIGGEDNWRECAWARNEGGDLVVVVVVVVCLEVNWKGRKACARKGRERR